MPTSRPRFKRHASGTLLDLWNFASESKGSVTLDVQLFCFQKRSTLITMTVASISETFTSTRRAETMSTRHRPLNAHHWRLTKMVQTGWIERWYN